MTGISENQHSANVVNRQVYMANEQTFLVWIRTSIAIMGFGFFVDKFALSIKQMSIVLEHSATGNNLPPPHGYSEIVGIFFAGCGTLISLFAFFRYKKVEKQIDEDNYKSSSILDILLLLAVLTVGISLVTYLINSI